jgi:hypothetical protein
MRGASSAFKVAARRNLKAAIYAFKAMKLMRDMFAIW